MADPISDFVVVIRMINGASHSVPVRGEKSEDVLARYRGDAPYLEIATPSISAMLTREHIVDIMVLPKDQHDQLVRDQRAAMARQSGQGVVV